MVQHKVHLEEALFPLAPPSDGSCPWALSFLAPLFPRLADLPTSSHRANGRSHLGSASRPGGLADWLHVLLRFGSRQEACCKGAKTTTGLLCMFAAAVWHPPFVVLSRYRPRTEEMANGAVVPFRGFLVSEGRLVGSVLPPFADPQSRAQNPGPKEEGDPEEWLVMVAVVEAATWRQEGRLTSIQAGWQIRK